MLIVLPPLLLQSPNPSDSHTKKRHAYVALQSSLSLQSLFTVTSFSRSYYRFLHQGELVSSLPYITQRSNEQNPCNASLKVFCSVIPCLHNAAIKELSQAALLSQGAGLSCHPAKQQQLRLLIFQKQKESQYLQWKQTTKSTAQGQLGFMFVSCSLRSLVFVNHWIHSRKCNGCYSTCEKTSCFPLLHITKF